MTYFPKKNSLRERIYRALVKFGEPMSANQIASIFKGERKSSVVMAIHQLKFYKSLSLDKGFYALEPHILQHYGVEVEMPQEEPVVLAPVASFVPWTGKYDPANVPRREPIRDIGFKSSSTSYGRLA